MDELLSPETVAAYLASRGLLPAGEPVEAKELSGGISNVVLGVEARDFRAVVKQALPKLRVADDWPAKRERATTEAEVLKLCGQLTPGRVPAVLDSDPASFALTTAFAPDDWTNWKSSLLSGNVDPAVAAALGETLVEWHLRTDGTAGAFDDQEAFEQLRVDPYYRTVMRRRPDVADLVEPYVARMTATRQCLVHGDFSPKNVLVGDDGLWVVDFEVAHLGDPAFDLAFMTNHLMLKSIHRPEASQSFFDCASSFWDAYSRRSPIDGSYVLGHVGCLMTARVDGKSPAEYLTDGGRETARAVGKRLLQDPPGEIEGAWARLV
ncbi:MAG TPA: phosphotransferase [Actinomycetota bacterium]|nr:phosphotransferase [Actinomycetota bacterium]